MSDPNMQPYRIIMHLSHSVHSYDLLLCARYYLGGRDTTAKESEVPTLRYTDQ